MTYSATAPAPESRGDALWRFGEFELDERTLELSRDGAVRPLPRKPLELLLYFLRHPGEVVTKEELLEALWLGRVVSESSLFQCVAELRKALGPPGEAAIRTVHGYGYRWMLEAHAENRGRSRAAAAPLTALKAGESPPMRPNWRLVERLGDGNGDVWVAEHVKTHARRTFKFGQDGASLAALKREITLFRLLSQTLGERHDFAAVLDWNFEEPPYFVETEFVPDGSLRDWAEAQGGLTAIPLETRLALIAGIAEALGAAHSAGVLHKDLKPANVLIGIDENGEVYPKLADLGSGRVLEADRLRALEITRLGFTQAADEESTSGTWAYLAPEVAAGHPPTAKTDLYALGVMLYQVIAGDFRRPLTAGWEADVSDELLREDIAALADVDPMRRLADANELARRLAALPQRRAEREQQRREQLEAAAARAALARTRTRRRWLTAVAGTLLLGCAVSTALYINARKARDVAAAQRSLAEEKADLAQTVIDYLNKDLIAAANPAASNSSDLTVAEILDTAASSASERFAGRPRVEAAIRLTLGQSYLGLGNLVDAETQLTAALTLLERTGTGTEPDSIQARLQLADVMMFDGRLAEARALLVEVVRLVTPADDAQSWLHAQGRLAGLKKMQGDTAGALRRLEEVLPLAIAELGVDHETTQELQEMLAGSLEDSGRLEEAIGLYRNALQSAVDRLGKSHIGTFRPQANLGGALRAAGQLEEALAPMESAVAGYRAVLGEDHVQTLWATHKLGLLYVDLQRLEDARTLLQTTARARARVLGPEHPDTLSSNRELARVELAMEEVALSEGS